uniref:Uncharacterized protein n=1 Tax=Caenorhabditis japonica TaxID=281687 RepID=A0A8R1EGD0_CAEJA
MSDCPLGDFNTLSLTNVPDRFVLGPRSDARLYELLLGHAGVLKFDTFDAPYTKCNAMDAGFQSHLACSWKSFFVALAYVIGDGVVMMALAVKISFPEKSVR